MYKFLTCLAMLLAGFLSVFAQSSNDFEGILSNSYKKLYTDPVSGIRIAKSTSVPDNNSNDYYLLQLLVVDGYQMTGEYKEAIRTASELSKVPLSDAKLLISQLFLEFDLTAQAGKEIADVGKDRKFTARASQESLVIARYFYLKTIYLLKQKKYKEALKSLEQSNAHVPDKRDFLSALVSAENLLIKGKIALNTGDLATAEKLAQELSSVPIALENTPYFNSKYHYYLGEIALRKNNHPLAVSLFEKSLADLGEINFAVQRKEIYKKLSQLYFEDKNLAAYESFQKKYDELQNKIEDDKKEAVRDLVQLDEEIENQNYSRIHSQKRRTLLYTLAGCAGILLVIGTWYYQEIQKKKILRKHELLLEEGLRENKPATAETPVKSKEDNEPQKKTLFIPKDTEQEILQKLVDFEKSETFLDKQLSLGAVAAQLGTNTKYLSEIINKYKGKSFTTYINELRINYITNLIDTDPAYHQYKISYLADLAGFITHSTFTVVFKSVKGISPNAYIQQARKNAKL